MRDFLIRLGRRRPLGEKTWGCTPKETGRAPREQNTLREEQKRASKRLAPVHAPKTPLRTLFTIHLHKLFKDTCDEYLNPQVNFPIKQDCKIHPQEVIIPTLLQS